MAIFVLIPVSPSPSPERGPLEVLENKLLNQQMMFHLETKWEGEGKGERRQFLKHLKSYYMEERDLL